MLDRLSPEKFVGARIQSYVVEQLVEQNELGALYTARDSVRGATYSLTILSIPLGTADAGYSNVSHDSSVFDALANQASAIAALQHPYILPLIDYGTVGDLPYLVWPAIPTRPLTSRLAQGNVLDPVTVGRYLDEIASAVEYAHEHLVLHRSLTIDSLSLKRDGRILVQDFGVRRMLEQGRKDAEWYALRNWNEACAPEQILGLAAGPATDVYAMGVVLYQLLTGEPPYNGARRKDIMQQHLQIPLPSLRLKRPDLPGDLDSILSAATAKQVSDRLSQPGVLANAYHDIVSPQQAGRMPFKISTSPSTSLPLSNGKVVQDQVLPGAVRSNPGYTPAGEQPGTLSPVQRYRDSRSAISPPAATPPASRSSFPRTILIVGLVAALLLGSFLAVVKLRPPVVAASGQVTFMDSGAGALGQTNALSISVTSLPQPASGSAYHAWLIDNQTERVLRLGELTQHGTSYSLSYQSLGPPGGSPGTNLLTLGTLLEITLEHGNVLLPTGNIVLKGRFPPLSFVHVGHLLVSYPTTPDKIGLLVGAEVQTHLVEMQAQALQAAETSHNSVEIQCDAQSILDILQGQGGPQYQPLPGACQANHSGVVGDGFGLLGIESATYNTLTGYLSSASEHAALAATQPDATANLRAHAHDVEVILANVQKWVTSIEQDALIVVKTPISQSATQQIVSLAGEAWSGSGSNGSAPEQGGILAAFSQGQQMATLALVGNGS